MTSTPAAADRLADQQPVTVILRLVISDSGELVHGEIADLVGRVQSRFLNWERLTPAVQAFVASTTSQC